jgi:hypothetical protein
MLPLENKYVLLNFVDKLDCTIMTLFSRLHARPVINYVSIYYFLAYQDMFEKNGMNFVYKMPIWC